MIFVLIGCILAVLAIGLRVIFFWDSREFKIGLRYYICILISLGGTLSAAGGFIWLTGEPVDTKYDSSIMLSVLALLAAGIIAGFFAFSYDKTGPDEVALPSLLSACFVILFYLTFGAISFYMGKNKDIHNIEYANTFGPAIMWLLLAGNMMYDFLDYRKNPEPPKPGEPKK